MRTVVKLLLALLIVVAVAACSVATGSINDRVARDRAFVMDEFAQQVSIDADGQTTVVEVIDVTFTTERRGIIRDFDTRTAFPSTGSFHSVEVDQGDPSQPWNHATEGGPTGPSVRIGQADVWLAPGPYRYRLSYVAPSWYYELADRPGIVEVRIDAPGFDWPTDIEVSSLHVEAPGVILEAACVEGPRRTTTPCATPPEVDGNRARFAFRGFTDREGATALVRLNREDFSPEALIPTFAPAPLDQNTLPGPWMLDRTQAALLLLGLLMVPVLIWEIPATLLVYRDKKTDPALHHRQHPTAIPAPPSGLRPPELAGLRGQRDVNAAFLATLIDLEQRGLITTTTSAAPERRAKRTQPTVTIRANPRPADLDRLDAEFLDALLPMDLPLVLTGSYVPASAAAVQRAKDQVRTRVEDVYEDFGYTHDRGVLLSRSWFRILATLVWLVVAGALVALVSIATPLHPLAASIIAVLVMAGWGLVKALLRFELLPLNSAGRDMATQARAFARYLLTVEEEQLQWAGGQPGVSHHHPAVALLPYAVALGFAASWFKRFGPLMRQVAAASAAGGGVSNDTWWLHANAIRSFDRTVSDSARAPSSSSSGGGGGGGGSGGGGGGGRSW